MLGKLTAPTRSTGEPNPVVASFGSRKAIPRRYTPRLPTRFQSRQAGSFPTAGTSCHPTSS